MKSDEKEEYYEYLQLTVYDEDGQNMAGMCGWINYWTIAWEIVQKKKK